MATAATETDAPRPAATRCSPVAWSIPQRPPVPRTKPAGSETYANSTHAPPRFAAAPTKAPCAAPWTAKEPALHARSSSAPIAPCPNVASASPTPTSSASMLPGKPHLDPMLTSAEVTKTATPEACVCNPNVSAQPATARPAKAGCAPMTAAEEKTRPVWCAAIPETSSRRTIPFAKHKTEVTPTPPANIKQLPAPSSLSRPPWAAWEHFLALA